MAENSKIEWCDHTFNPWVGCAKVSPGCANCYAEQPMDKRLGQVEWGPQGTRRRTSEANWREPLKWDRKAQKEGRRYKVFCASLADVFEDRDELYPWREELFGLISETDNLDWLILTKRPENVMDMFDYITGPIRLGWESFSNIWIGTSVEDQKTADERIPHLLQIPARVRFLSMEPLLGPVSLDRWLGLEPGNVWAECLCDEISPEDRPCLTCEARRELGATSGIHWIIVGGESGPNARPMHPD